MRVAQPCEFALTMPARNVKCQGKNLRKVFLCLFLSSAKSGILKKGALCKQKELSHDSANVPGHGNFDMPVKLWDAASFAFMQVDRPSVARSFEQRSNSGNMIFCGSLRDGHCQWNGQLLCSQCEPMCRPTKSLRLQALRSTNNALVYYGKECIWHCVIQLGVRIVKNVCKPAFSGILQIGVGNIYRGYSGQNRSERWKCTTSAAFLSSKFFSLMIQH